MRRAVVVDVVRSPFGKGREGGSLHGIHPADLYAQVIESLIARTGIDAELIDDVITGCVLQVGEQSGNIGRQAALAAGLPVTVPAVTIDRKCGSSQQAVDFAAQAIVSGACDAVIAGGVEMMSTVPMRSNRLGRDNRGEMFRTRYPEGLIDQGISAELIAARWNISRADMDEFSLRSHERAARAEDLAMTTAGIIPVSARSTKISAPVVRDEGIRRDTSLAKLAALKPAFENPALQTRFPQIRWSVTAGNSSQVTDGAAAALILEESLARRLGMKPRAAVTHFQVLGDDPIMMLTAIIPATRRLLRKSGIALRDIGAFEVNEAFASVVLAWMRELEVDHASVNRYGGAIALGHPAGASGIRLLGNLLAALQQDNLRLGLQVMCESGGMANVTLIERV